MATLVHDDVLDDAEVRRQNDTINRLIGNEGAVLLGDYLISHSYHLCSRLESTEASRRIAAVTNTICEGELMQIENRGNFGLTEEQYLEIIRRKTASLTSLCCELGATVSGASSEVCRHLAEYGMLIGMAFQIVDDILDLTGSQETLGKPVASDLREGKVTLPIIYLLAEGDRELRRKVAMILEDGTFERVAWAEIVEGLTAIGALDRARARAREYADQAAVFLQGFPPSPVWECLQDLPRFVVERQR